MADLFDTRGVPDESEYWDALARRIAHHATRDPSRGAFVWLAESRTGFIAASVVCGLALASAAMVRGSSPGSRAAEWVLVITPADDVGSAITTSSTPPAIGTLLLRERR